MGYFDDFHAFMFQAGVDRIRDAFRISIASLEEVEREAGTAYDAYIASGEDDSEYDEDRCLTQSTALELDYSRMQAALAATVVRQVFITSAFHYWERSARSWTNYHHNGLAGLKATVQEKGHPVSDGNRYLHESSGLT